MIERIKERLPLIRPLFVPLILYIGLLAFAMNWLDGNPELTWRFPVALLPMVPGLFLVVGLVRAIGRLDELARKILLESMVFAFALTLILTMGLGLLGIAGLTPPNTIYIALFMSLAWLAGKFWITRRYQ